MKRFMKCFVAAMILALLATPALATEHKVGLGFGFAPDYEGSDDSQGIPMLMLKGKYDSGRSFTLMGTNLRVNLVPSSQYSFGPVVNYRQGRDDVENDQVYAMKDIDDALELGLYGMIDVNNFMLGAEFLADVSDEHDGMLGKVSVGYRWKAASSLTIIPMVYSTYADGDYMDTYFGINAGNRGTSTLPNYEADSGFKDVGITLSADYAFSEQWGLSGLLAYSALLNDAKDSPIVDDEGDDKQVTLGLMGTYRW